MPKVSFILPEYKRRFLHEAIASILVQTDCDFALRLSAFRYLLFWLYNLMRIALWPLVILRRRLKYGSSQLAKK